MTGTSRGIESFDQLAALIRDRFDTMSPQLQLAARHLLDHPEDVAVSSMRSVASQARVNPPTLVRLAQSLGFGGWQALRQLCIAHFRTHPKPYAAKAKSLIRHTETRELMAEMFLAQRTNLDSTEARNRETLLRAAQLLEDARAVHVAGFRACYPIAFAILYVYRLFRSSVSLLNAEAGTLEMQLRALSKGDAVIVISFAPYSREARQIAEAARAADCRVIALTDSALAPIALVADVTLLFSAGSPSFFPSVVAGMALAESLLELLASRGGNRVVRRIQAAEQQLFMTGAYEKAEPLGIPLPEAKQNAASSTASRTGKHRGGRAPGTNSLPRA